MELLPENFVLKKNLHAVFKKPFHNNIFCKAFLSYMYVIKAGSMTLVEKGPEESRVNSRDDILLDRQRGVVVVLHVGLDVLPIKD
jgi:hypothetical protein